MKVLKYNKRRGNEYKVTLDDNSTYILYDDVIIKYELLLQKEISKEKWKNIIKDNTLLKAYYDCIKELARKMRTEKELQTFLVKKDYTQEEINYAITRLKKEGYLDNKAYIVAYIHDALTLKMEGEIKIKNDLEKLGLPRAEIEEELSKIAKDVYLEKIAKYINKKLKVNKGSADGFKRKITNDLLNKGFLKEDIELGFINIPIEDNIEELKKLITKLYKKYIIKYDLYTTKLKIKNYLYTKGYKNIDIDKYIK